MPAGMIRLLSDRGFGYITSDTGSDVFFHQSKVEGVPFRLLTIGQRVRFTNANMGANGPCAEHVKGSRAIGAVSA